MSEYVVTIKNKKRNILISSDYKVSVDDRDFLFELNQLSDKTYLLKLNEKVYHVSAEKLNGDLFSVYIDGRNIEALTHSALQEKAIRLLEKSTVHAAHSTEVKAPMPGMILKIKKGIGENVTRGESIMILEAMKMENDLHSPASGIIKSITVAEGNAVEKGALLFLIE